MRFVKNRERVVMIKIDHINNFFFRIKAVKTLVSVGYLLQVSWVRELARGDGKHLLTARISLYCSA